MDFEAQPLLLFSNLREEHINLMRTFIESVSYKPGETVIQQGSLANYFYIICKGKAQISFKPYDGNSITITYVETGELFGWSAVIRSKTYTSSVIAIEPLEAARINGNKLRKLIKKHPEAGREILNSLADAISTRWKDAREQVRLILESGMR
ncbi:MAG: cyclic nucleotide-binding domain-containing protein [Anaerolineales bacterium]|nr:cyclic nucleotide-binding domain-containing protein [Anaerolineales bacterium]MCL4260888.1 cyclic nucleotide-binding domain-containing protein [Anaerolineales bacterium]